MKFAPEQVMVFTIVAYEEVLTVLTLVEEYIRSFVY